MGIFLPRKKRDYAPYRSPRPGWAEQSPELFWDSLVDGCRRLKIRHPEAFAEIGGVGVTAQRDTMINMAEDGGVLRPAITWLDSRKAEGSYRPNPLMSAAFHLVGKDKAIRKSMRDGKCNWIRENQDGIWERTWKYVQVSGFLNYRLTGVPFDSVASMVGHVPMDFRKRRWARPKSLYGKLFPVEEEKLYALMEAGEQGGAITAEAALVTGLAEGIPVFACGSDKSCETIGSGCLDRGAASLSFGTTATVEVTTDRYFEPIPFLPAYCAAYPGSWLPEVEIFRGYWMISWFRDELGQKEITEAEKLGVIPEELLNRLLDTEPPGCRGLMMQPYWSAGLKDPLAKGSFVGFGDAHTRGSLYRATIEGLGYALRDGLETLERRGRFKVNQVAASGGASQSNAICQISADIIGRPLTRGRTYETSGLGAAVLTAVGMGIHPSIDEAVRRMVRTERTFYPRAEESSLYEKLFNVYRKIYPRLKGIFRDIQGITGYPEL